MDSVRLAESLLSLVMSPAGAASTVGDLVEEGGTGRRFWGRVVRTFLAFLWRDFSRAPIRLVGSAIVGWFIYMTMSMGLLLIAWGVGYFFAHHTGFEWLGIGRAFGWPPGPNGLTRWIEIPILLLLAPFNMGGLIARWCRGREIAACVAVGLVWPLMAASVTFVALSTHVSLAMLPVVQIALCAGAIRVRRAARVT